MEEQIYELLMDVIANPNERKDTAIALDKVRDLIQTEVMTSATVKIGDQFTVTMKQDKGNVALNLSSKQSVTITV